MKATGKTTLASRREPAARAEPPAPAPGRTRLGDRVVAHVRDLIEQGRFRPGHRLPGERELASQLGVSRPSLRAGLQALSAMGIVESRRGSGTYITSGPPTLAAEGLQLFAALHNIARADMFEARRLLEVGVARLAAERARGEDVAAISEAVMDMFASIDDPHAYLVHASRFHNAIGRACGNPVLVAFVELVQELFYEQRKGTVNRDRALAIDADAHRRIYQAIRDHDVELAGKLMDQHLMKAKHRQDREDEENAKERRDGQTARPARARRAGAAG